MTTTSTTAPLPHAVTALSYTPSFSHVAVIATSTSTSTSISTLSPPASSELRVTHTPSPSSLHPTQPTSIPFPSACLARAPSSSTFTALSFATPSSLYAATSSGSILLYNPTSPSNSPLFHVRAAHAASPLTCITATTYNNSTFASAARDGLVKIWQPTSAHSPTCVSKLKAHRYDVRALSITPHPSLALLASAGRDRSIKLWDLKAPPNSALVHSFDAAHAAWVHSVALRDVDATLVSCAGDKAVKVWDLRNMSERQRFDGHEYRVWSVDVTRNESGSVFAVSGSTDMTTRLWKLDDHDQNQSINDTDSKNMDKNKNKNKNNAIILQNGHTESVLTVACNNDGSVVMSGAENGSVLAWAGSANFNDTRPQEDQINDINANPTTTTINNINIPNLIDIDDELTTCLNTQPCSTNNNTPPKSMDTAQLQVHSARPEHEPNYDKSAAELVGALTTVHRLEHEVRDVRARNEALIADVAARDRTIAQLQKEVDSLRKLEQQVDISNMITVHSEAEYKEPVNKIGAVSDQLTKLAARLDAMIATR